VNCERSPVRGFTLLEVTIATGLLVTIALGSAQMFALAIRHNVSAKQQLLMSVVAARKIDELSAAAAAGALQPSPPDALERSAEGFADVADEAGATYTRRWLVSPLPGYGGAALVIAVRVSRPPAGEGPGRDVQITTICEAGS